MVFQNLELRIKVTHIMHAGGSNNESRDENAVRLIQYESDGVADHGQQLLVPLPRTFEGRHLQVSIIDVSGVRETRVAFALKMFDCSNLPFEFLGQPGVIRIQEGDPITFGVGDAKVQGSALALLCLSNRSEEHTS